MAKRPPDPAFFPSTMAFNGPAPQTSAAPLERLAQYRIVKPLGRGGMGVVYQAEDTQLNRMAALKVMRADYAADPEALARFLREAQAAARLKHDHIVTIYQVGQENGMPFLAMEFLAGKSLEEWLRPDRRATIVEALLISKQIARGLAAAHAANLIHRDIKPANLWLEAPRGRLKILDFGLARQTKGEQPTLTQDGSIVGTPAFMAPEQARGDAVDHRCDLFSLGCVMYRILTGRLPFEGTTTFAVLTAIAVATPPSPIRIRSEIPQRLSDLIESLLAKKPEQRPASAQAVLDELAKIEEQVKQPPSLPSLLSSPPAAVLPVAALPSSSLPADTLSSMPAGLPTVRLAKAARRKGKNSSVVYIVLGVTATAVALVGLLAFMMHRPTDQEPTRPKIAKRSNPSKPSTEVSAAKNTNTEAEVPRPQPAVDTDRPIPSLPVVDVRGTKAPRDSKSFEPSVVPSEGMTASITQLSELNTAADDVYPWVSRDGLEIYFTHDVSTDSKTFRASRRSVNDPFGPPTVVNSLRQAVLSADGFVMVGLKTDDGMERLAEARRASIREGFPRAMVIESLTGKLSPKSPWLSSDGLRLVFQRIDVVGDYPGKMSAQAMRQTEFVQCRRNSTADAWSQPVRLPMADHALYTDALTWPSLSEDRLTLFFCNGGHRFAEVMYATRATESEAFADPQKVIVEGRPLVGRSPRYVAATRELYLNRDNGTPSESKDFDLCVVKDFVPQTSVAGSTRPKKPDWPDDAHEFGGHYYKFYPEVLNRREARDRCIAVGGHLVVIESAAENAFVAGLVEKAKGLHAWIDITDQTKEGMWLTSEGEPVTYTNWFTGQPNGKETGEDFAVISGKSTTKESFNWRWGDQPNQAQPFHQPIGYLCEWDPPAKEAANAGFISLFDGKSLKGWDGKASFWSVRDGAITGESTASNPTTNNTCCIYQGGKLGDFELRLKFKIVGGNSGIQYRSEDKGNYIVNGYQFDIDSNLKYMGVLYEEGGRGVLANRGAKVEINASGGKKVLGTTADEKEILASIKQDDWNECVLIARGNRLIQKINGHVTVDVTDDQKGKAQREGVLALQLHAGPPMRVQFKDIELKKEKVARGGE